VVLLRRYLFIAACLGIVIPAAAGKDHLPALDDLLRREEFLLRDGKNPAGISEDDRFGADPYRILHLPRGEKTLVLLRGRSEIVLVDGSFRAMDKKLTPRHPTGWALVGGRYLFVGGELSANVALYEITSGSLRAMGTLRPRGLTSVRDLVYVPSHHTLFILDDFNRRLVQLVLKPGWPEQKPLEFEQRDFPLGAGPLQIRYRDNHLLINLLLEHTLLIVPLIHGRPEFQLASRITHNGPIWGFDAFTSGGVLTLAVTGVEDHPLDRSGGEFGYVDSFLFVYRVPRHAESGTYRWNDRNGYQSQRTVFNLSEVDLVTPKVVRFDAATGNSVSVWVAAFGTGKVARFELRPDGIELRGRFDAPAGTTDFALMPKTEGTAAAGPVLIIVSSLLDGAYRLKVTGKESEYEKLPGLSIAPPPLSWQSRLGELLVFTTLMTPQNRSDGELSRLTCEACHFEGTIDGRVHYTGREHVFATTKPLRGLANNVPLFSRAGDQSLSSMVLAEFRVANQARRDDFVIEARTNAWLTEVDGLPAVISPADLRTALLSFFFDFRHRPNPWRIKWKTLSNRALKGLAVFRDRCEYCHRSTPSTREWKSLPFGQWHEWLEGEKGDLVWGAPFFAKTGIRPYVHRAGARVPSLRRVLQKSPYFTDGSSPTLRHLLRRFRFGESAAWHQFEPETEVPDANEVQALTADEADALAELLRWF